MDRPRVTVHNMTSIDGRLSGFPDDPFLYYELAATFPQDAVLAGSNTLVEAAAREGVDLSREDEPDAIETQPADDPRPWLVVVDGRGRLTRFAWLRRQPFWRDVLVLACASTPPAHLDLLRRHRVAYQIIGTEHVDLAAALRLLADRYGVRAVRVDAGGTLNGLLLAAGLVDEISVVVAPHLVGTPDAGARHVVDGLADGVAPPMTLVAVERVRDDHVWLRYRPATPGAGG